MSAVDQYNQAANDRTCPPELADLNAALSFTCIPDTDLACIYVIVNTWFHGQSMWRLHLTFPALDRARSCGYTSMVYDQIADLVDPDELCGDEHDTISLAIGDTMASIVESGSSLSVCVAMEL